MWNTHVSLDLSLDQLIISVREQFMRERYAINPTNYDQIDIEKLKSHDYTIKRFLVDQEMNKELALNQLDEAMKWRKSFGVNQLDYSDLPIEFFKIGAFFSYNEDKAGRPVIYKRSKAFIKVAKMDVLLKKAIVLTINKIDELADEKGFTVFIDDTDLELKNADLRLGRFIVNILRNYFPGAVKCVIVYNIPFIFGKFVSLAKYFIGSKYSNIFNTLNNTEEIFEFIDRENVPKYLGGNCEQDFTKLHPNCTLNALELAAKYSIDEKEMKKFLKLYEPIINESKLLNKIN